ncbi:imidazole glycerol phosphate synthase subunit HisH [Thermodesulfobacteriota bacterium]
MSDPVRPLVAVVDFGMGNLFSVQKACEHVGLAAKVTSSGEEILSADAVILPGVGAFGDAMSALRRLKLVSVLEAVAESSKLLLGICLGMQLLMRESYEFGHHTGLGIIPGHVVRFEHPKGEPGALKVPQVGWNRLFRAQSAGSETWDDTLLDGLPDGVYMYFVHSFYAEPSDDSVVLATTRYGDIEFCSALRHNHVSAFQFHPERSGRDGLKIYANLGAQLRNNDDL